MRLFETLFIVALVLYSFVIWSHKVKRKLYPWMAWLFGSALIADISGTVFLCMMAAERWKFTLHAISGFLSLFIMTLHFSWAVFAISIGGKFEIYFNRFSIYAWYLWVIAFISGFLL